MSKDYYIQGWYKLILEASTNLSNNTKSKRKCRTLFNKKLNNETLIVNIKK